MADFLLSPINLGEFRETISQCVKAEILSLKADLLNKEAIDDLLTRKQACDLLKIDQSSLYLWTKKGKVKAYGIGNRRYYKRSELMNSLVELKTKYNEI